MPVVKRKRLLAARRKLSVARKRIPLLVGRVCVWVGVRLGVRVRPSLTPSLFQKSSACINAMPRVVNAMPVVAQEAFGRPPQALSCQKTYSVVGRVRVCVWV